METQRKCMAAESETVVRESEQYLAGLMTRV